MAGEAAGQVVMVALEGISGVAEMVAAMVEEAAEPLAWAAVEVGTAEAWQGLEAMAVGTQVRVRVVRSEAQAAMDGN